MNYIGAYFTDRYRNLINDYGYKKDEINNRVKETWNKLFTSNCPETQIFFQTDNNMGYMLDTGNNDVRTEGMSYGMMMAVQMDEKDIFDQLWLWTKTFMYMEEGENAGYFAWSCSPDGTKNSYGPAPDGEEYFALALFFASHRWGDGVVPYNYSEQAKDLLHCCIHKGDNNDGYPMWNRANKLIKFVPNVEFSDPSYHLPHFYELFALWANEIDRPFWKEAAQESRKYIAQSAHPVTGLTPEYAFYNGSPNHIRGFGHFYSDSYRVACNIALDYEWFRDNACPTVVNEKIQNFFVDKDPGDYRRYRIDGEPFEEKALHPVGLIATNAMASLATSGENARKSIELFWNTPLRTGKRRYYDNCLYFFSLLALSGNFRIYKPD
ncbi:reducing-end-xylose releasing exo-oligoxylanase [Gracilibacillus ureilyticus]|uniref:Reducing-end-xylose releasing exo-oligoxylanase n=1 Tax=Gracilibacillus ureilyticus TaxID=531814 RepID=A0A1H9PRV3_9BACI|nr:glycosyl hydrolase family 8 [Gracilibacillus ureilyticus]SER50838.1 reducing-end-xylose releasing exo-oligoxylanase [Gracilibacillus ureilyticus]